MRLAAMQGLDERAQVEQIALVCTASAVVEIDYHGAGATWGGPLLIFSAPRAALDATMPACGCNPYVGHVIARSIEDAHRLRDALDLAIQRAEKPA